MRIPEHWRTQERERTLKGVGERPVTPRPVEVYNFAWPLLQLKGVSPTPPEQKESISRGRQAAD